MSGFVKVTTRDPHIAELRLGRQVFLIRFHQDVLIDRLRQIGFSQSLPTVRFSTAARGYIGEYHLADRSISLYLREMVLNRKIRARHIERLIPELAKTIVHEYRHAWQHSRCSWLHWPSLVFGWLTMLPVFLVTLPRMMIEMLVSQTYEHEARVIRRGMLPSLKVGYYAQWHEIDARLIAWWERHERVWQQAFSIERIE